MRALVTGGTGFVGSHLVRHLIDRGSAVAVLARPGTDDHRIADVRSSLTWIEGDLRDVAASRGEIADFAPDVVYHLGWGGVGRSGRDDRLQIDANLAGSLALFDVAAGLGCGAFVGLGSQAEYGPHDGLIDESTPLHPDTLYGAAKASASLLLDRLAEASGVRLAWLRLFSAYGPGDHPDALIPWLIRSLDAGESPSVFRPSQEWDFLHVEDAASAVARAGESADVRGVYNLASGRSETLRRVAERIRDRMDRTRPLRFGTDRDAPGLRADVSRLTAAIGPIARIDPDDGLARTIAWHRRDSTLRRSA